MRQKVTRLATLVAFFGALLGGNLSPLLASAAADTCTWTGATSANWSDGTNWTGCDNGGVPENGDTLLFAQSGSNKSMNNNIAGLTPNQVQITGTGYTFGGNALTFVTSGGAFSASQDATVNLQVAFNAFNDGGSVSTGKTLTFAQPVAFSNTGGNYWTGGGLVVFNGTITGAAGTFQARNGITLKVAGSGNTYTSSTVGAESNSHFQCGSTTCFGSNANSIYSGGGIVDLLVAGTYSNSIQTSIVTPDDSWIKAFDNVTLSGTATVTDPLNIAQYGSGAKNLQFTGTINLVSSSNVTFDGTDSNNSLIHVNSGLNGSGSVDVKNAYVQMNTANTYDGATNVHAGGILSAENATALGGTSAGTTVESGGELRLGGSSAFTSNEPLTIEGSGIGSVGGAIKNAATADVVLGGSIALTDDTTISSTDDANLNLNGQITGTGNITTYAPSTNHTIFFANGTPNTYVGTFTNTGGQTYLTGTNAATGDVYATPTDPSDMAIISAGDNVIAPTATLHLSDGGMYATNGGSNTVAGLTGTGGEIRLIASTDVLTINQNFNSTYAGIFDGGSHSGTVIKKGTGILMLTGDSTTDNVKFENQGGSTSVNGDQSVNDFTITGGKLKGTGTAGNVTITNATVAPGNSPGALHVTSLAFNGTSTFEEEIAGATAGTQYDQLIASGTVNLGSSTLSLNPSYTPANGTVFTIVQAGTVTGTFAGLADGATVTANGLTFRVNYTGTTVTLTYLSGTVTTTPSSGSTSLVDTGTNALLTIIASATLMGSAIALIRRKPTTTQRV